MLSSRVEAVFGLNALSESGGEKQLFEKPDEIPTFKMYMCGSSCSEHVVQAVTTNMLYVKH